MKTAKFLEVFEITMTSGSLIWKLFEKKWNQQFFGSAIFKEPELVVL
jgi:hypothetical protein